MDRNHDVAPERAGAAIGRRDVVNPTYIASSAIYAADAPHAFRSTEMEGLAVVYHRPSGATHILAAPAPELIALLGDRPRPLGEILHAFGLADDHQAARLVAERLAELEAAGLVWRA